jgi:two-component system cell cycle sensor histidine kinase/response regulator CckA
MIRKSLAQHLDTLEKRWQELQDKAGVLPEACEDLEIALREVSLAIAAVRAAHEAGLTPPEEIPGGPEAPAGGAPGEPPPETPARCETILSNIFNAIPDQLSVIDRDFNIVMSNWHVGEEVLERARRGQPKCYRVYHRRDRPCEDCHVLKVFATGQPQKVEKTDELDGRVLEFSAFSIQNESGQVVLVAEHVRDITQRHLAEQAFRESEGRFRTLIEDSPESLFLTDVQGIVLTASRVAVQRLGKNLSEVTGTSLFGHLPPKVASQRWPFFEQAVATGRPVRFEDTRDDFHFEIHVHPILDADGKVSMLSIMALDITDRKQAEAALLESEERFKLLFEYAPDAYFLMDVQGNFLDANRAAEKLTGYRQEEMIGQNFQTLPLLDDGQKTLVTELLAQSVYGEVVGPVDLTLSRKEGREVIIEVKGLPLEIKGQSLLLGIARDITARKQAEEALRESEQRFRDITAYAAEWVWEVDAQGKYIYSSPVVEQLLGYKPEEVLDKHFYDFFIPEEREELKQAALALFAAKQPFRNFLNPSVHKNGRIIWLSTSGIPILDEQGNLRGYRGADIDISERREAEELSRNLIAKSPVGIYLIQHGKFQRANQWFFAISGYSEDELLHLKPLELIHPEDREATRENAVKMLKGLSSVPYEYRTITKGGEARWIMETVTTIQYKGERAALGYFMDIAERKQLENQLLQAQKMEAVGRLAGGVAHDFNNLLMTITGYGELMRAKVLKGDPLHEHLKNMLKASDRAAALTQQLLTFSRRQIVRPQVVDLNRVVLDLEPMLRRLIGEDLELEITTDPGPVAVKADPGQLGQIIMNLVVNARDAMPRGGRLSLKTAPVEVKGSRPTRFGPVPPGAYVMLMVRDTGVGMDEAIQAHIFEPFFTTKEPGKGTGLGLPTVYGIVNQSKGYIAVDSEPKKGSTFTIYLPRLTAITAPPKKEAPLLASFRGEETILLVEDEDILRTLLAKFLRLYGYTVLEARHGGEALLLCERHPEPIHLMVTDVVMPQMSGRELADRLAPLRPAMKVVYMSGYTDDSMVHYDVGDLSVPFLQKPFKPIELARQVHAVLHPPGRP